MTVFYRPDSIAGADEVEKQDRETLEAIQKAIEDANVAAGNALAASSLVQGAVDAANDAVRRAEAAVKAATEKLDAYLPDAEEAEAGREDAERTRVSQEEARETAEAGRADAELERVRAEAVRQTQEGVRRDAEALRESAEADRRALYDDAGAAEDDRKASETARESAELSRADAEGKRAIAEEGRVAAEEGRVSADAQRASSMADIVAQWQDLLQDLGVFTIRMLRDGQYDPATGVPSIEGETGIIYVAPSPEPGEHNAKIEWLYLEGEWEKVDSTNLKLGKISTTDIDSVVADEHPADEDRYLNLTGLSNLWTKLTGWVKTKATAFAATKLASKHNLRVDLSTDAAGVFDGSADATIGVTGALDVANGGTGATTADAAWKALGGGSVGKIDLDGTPGGYLDSDGHFTVPVDKDTTYEVATKGNPGLMPALTGETNKWLDADGKFTTPPNDNTTYGVVTAKAAGLIPAYGGSTDKFWRDDGTYAVPRDTTYEAATSKADGLMSAADKAKFDAITTGAATSLVLANGTTMTFDAFVTAVIEKVRAGLGVATTARDGLMPKLPTSANAAALYANSDPGYSEPIRDV